MNLINQLLNSRDYWRTCSTTRLIEEARYSDHELCIALGERLEDFDQANRQLEAVLEELNNLRQTRTEQFHDEDENDDD